LILELAHGTGNLQIDLAYADARAIGYDLSPAMGSIARRKLLKRGMKVLLSRGMAQALPFSDECFSSVVSTFPSEFISAPETLVEIRRVLQPDGVFIIVPGASFTGGGVAKTVLDWLYQITGQREAEAIADHARLTEWLSPYGFEVQVYEEPCPRSLALVIVARKVDRHVRSP
jgi:ubiquinone/menaquinone biosynthesis C-methylase UbiE